MIPFSQINPCARLPRRRIDSISCLFTGRKLSNQSHQPCVHRLAIMAAQRQVVVTGGNSGIGKALCKQLATEDNCRVFLGSRNAERGAAAVESILSEAPGANIELLQIDVTSDASVAAAAADLKGRLSAGSSLFALVNNAGTGFAHNSAADSVLDVNLYGTPQCVSAAVSGDRKAH